MNTEVKVHWTEQLARQWELEADANYYDQDRASAYRTCARALRHHAQLHGSVGLDKADPVDQTVLAVSIQEAARRLGSSRSVVYDLINAGRLPARKLGRRTFILVEDLRAFLVKLPHTTEI